jgi:hypothetical protein
VITFAIINHLRLDVLYILWPAFLAFLPLNIFQPAGCNHNANLTITPPRTPSYKGILYNSFGLNLPNVRYICPRPPFLRDKGKRRNGGVVHKHYYVNVAMENIW